jgi:hydroxypyruvate isomerase
MAINRTDRCGYRQVRASVFHIGLIRGIIKLGVDANQAMDWLVEALRECCAAAWPRGLRLALEPINRYETTLGIQIFTEERVCTLIFPSKNF